MIHLRYRFQTILIAGVLHALVAVSLVVPVWADNVPGEKQTQPIALIGGTVHRIDAPAEIADLLFKNGSIVAIGSNIQIPDDAKRIDVTNHHVYPGLIDADSSIGLVEIDAVRATDDLSEVGQLNPNARAAVAFNPDSEMIPVTRANGVLLTNVVPRGSFVTGQSSLMQLDGWNVDDMMVKSETGLHVVWPRIDPEKQHNEQIELLSKLFADARAYHDLRAANDGEKQNGTELDGAKLYDARLEALGAVLARESKLFAHTDALLSIQSAVTFAEKQAVRLVIVGGYDAPRAARLLKKHKVPVVVTGTQRLPQTRHAAYDEPFTVPRRLQDAGVRFCIGGEGRFGASNGRNLPYQAATAAAYGLPADIALRSITLDAAKILGIAKKVGSLTEDKQATLFVANGDILEVATQVTHAFVQGRAVSLESRHTRLYDKFHTKYERNKGEKE